MSTDPEFPMGQRAQALWMTIHCDHRPNAAPDSGFHFTPIDGCVVYGMGR